MADSWWDDFTNNLATDFAPLIALFGEQPTKQYLSECLTAVDIFIFATAPLGVITAIVSAIRVCGTSTLRAFIGRAQEGAGNAEAELCSSTSRDVCELYNNGGIARVFGRPKILEIVHDPNATKEDFFASHAGGKPSAGIYTFRDFKNKGNGQLEWEEVTGRKPSNPQEEQQPSEEREDKFAPNPNLSLNVGIKHRSKFWFYAAAVVGATVQSTVLVWAAVARYWLHWLRNDVQDKYAVPSTVMGTFILAFGVGLCAFLVERSTQERVFQRRLGPNSPKEPKSRMYWVQPGDQVIGDQVFDSFAYTDLKAPLSKYTSSRKQESPERGLVPTIFLVWGAVLSSLVGFVLQFVGIRACHSSVSLAQLLATILMSIIRASLRAQRIEKKDNITKDAALFQGHELDWLALEIDLPTKDPDGPDLRRHLWRVFSHGSGNVDYEEEHFNAEDPPSNVPANDPAHVISRHRLRSGSRSVLVGLVSAPAHSSFSNQNFKLHPCYRPSVNATPVSNLHSTTKTFLYRTRLAHMTGLDELNLSESSKWGQSFVSVRATAQHLANAIESTMTVLFNTDTARPIVFEEPWKDCFKIFCPVDSAILGPKECVTENDIFVSVKQESGSWQVDPAELEAILGLWVWSFRNSPKIPSQKSKLRWSRLFRTSASVELDVWRPKDSKKSQEIVLELDLHDKNSIRETASLQNALWWEDDKRFVMKETIHPRQGEATSANLTRERRPPAGAKDLRHFFGLQTLDTSNPHEVNALELTIVTSMISACAQELYTKFLDAVMHTIKDLGGESEVKKGRVSFHVVNENIDRLHNAFVQSGLGSPAIAFACILPILYTQRKFPSIDHALSAARDVAEEHANQKRFEQAADLLHWALGQLRLSTGKVQTEIQNEQRLWILALSECYRQALFDEGRTSPTFGYKGILGLLKTELPRLRKEGISLLYLEQSATSEPSKGNEYLTLADALLCYAQVSLSSPMVEEATEEVQRIISLIRDILDDCQTSDHIEKNTRTNPDVEEPRSLVGTVEEDNSSSENTAQSLLLDEGAQEPESPFDAIQVGDLSSILYLLGIIKAEGVMSDAGAVLLFAAQKGWVMVVKALAQMDADIHAKDRHNRSSIYFAANGGDINTFNYLLNSGASPNIPDNSGRTALDWAAEKGHSTIIQKLLNDPRVDTNPRDKFGKTPLMRAARSGANAVVAQLLSSSRVDANAHDKKRQTSLMLAVENNQRHIVEQLVEKRRADVKLRDRKGRTALSRAVLCGHMPFVHLLRSVDPTLENVRDGSGRTPLSLAVGIKEDEEDSESGYEETEYLYSSYYTSDYTDSEGSAVKMDGAEQRDQGRMDGDGSLGTVATTKRHVDKNSTGDNLSFQSPRYIYYPDIFSELLNGTHAEPNTRDDLGKTPLSHAVAMGNIEAVKQLLAKKSVDPNIADVSQKTPLWYAVSIEDVDVVEQLVSSKSVDPNVPEHDSPLTLAVEKGADLIVEHLLSSSKIKPNQIGSSNDTPLSFAARVGHVSLVRMLLDHDTVDVNAKTGKCETPLMVACQSGQDVVVSLLLDDTSVLVNEKADNGDTALILAARDGRDDVVKGLLSFEDIWVNEKNNHGDTPLIAAIREKRDTVVQVLLRHKEVDVNACNDSGESALAVAVKTESIAAICKLLEHKELDFSHKDGKGPTILELAVEADNLDALQLLLDHRSVTVDALFKKMDNGNTPLLVAASHGSRQTVKLALKGSNLDLNLRDSLGRSLLSYASEHAWEDIICNILSRTEKAHDDHDESNRDPLSYAAAAKGDALEVVRILIEAGEFDLNGRDDDSRTALSYAAENGCRKILTYLVSKHGINPDIHDNLGRTALSYAAGKNDLGAVETLLSTEEVNPDSADNQGATPLFHAVLAEQSPEKVRVLRWFRGRPHAERVFEHGLKRGTDAEVVRALLNTGKVNPNRKYAGHDYLAIHFAALFEYEKAVGYLLPWVRPTDRLRTQTILKACHMGQAWSAVNWKYEDDDPHGGEYSVAIALPPFALRPWHRDSVGINVFDILLHIGECAMVYGRRCQ